MDYHRLAAVCSCLLALVLPAQQSQPPGPVLRVTTHLVQVNVIVHARKNEPVNDLTKDDFALYDQGQRQQIATFSVESSRPAPGSATKPVPPLNTFTNRVELRRSAPKAVTVILLDGLNTRFEDQGYAKQQVIKFLENLDQEDRVGLYVLGRDLRILHDFTSDSGPLLRALARHRGRAAVELADSEPADPDTGDENLDQWMAEANQTIADFQTINRVRTTLTAIEAIANHVARLPGRKNLIWVSGGFPYSIGLDEFAVSNTQEKRTFSEELERAAHAVNNANLAVYPVDARGLIGLPDFSPSVRGSANPRRPPPGPANSKAMRNIQRTHDTMEILAQRTGGKAYYNSNDIKNALRDAIDDSRVTYVLGYYPTHNTWDGKFHDIKVQVNRKGVNVRHRLGYFAFSEQPQGQQDRQAALREAAWSALDATSIGLTLRLGKDVPKPGKLRVILQVDPRNVSLEQKNDRWAGQLDILFVQQASPDKAPSVVNDSLSMNLTRETYEQALKRGLLLGKDLELADAAYLLRVAVRDAVTGNVGSVNVRTDRLKPEPAAVKPDRTKNPPL